MKRLMLGMSVVMCSLVGGAFMQHTHAGYYDEFVPAQQGELVQRLDKVVDRILKMSEANQDRAIVRLENAKERLGFVPFIGGVLDYILAGVNGTSGEVLAQGNIVEIASNNDDFSTLVAAVVAADLVDALQDTGPFTVLAPTNQAFENLLSQLDMTLDELVGNVDLLTTVLLYHVIPGDIRASDVVALPNGTLVETLNGESIRVTNRNKVQFNNSDVITTDIIASNGVIHSIDEVLLPPTVVVSLGGETDQVEENIVEVAVASEMFPTLVAAVQSAGLVDALSSEAPITVYAPTEEAFAQLLEDLDMTAEQLLSDTELLTSVLLYHVVGARYDADDILGLTESVSSLTLQGTTISIDPNNGTPTVNGCNIVETDIFAANGIIHVIDCVLIP